MKGNFIFFILLCAPEGAKCDVTNLIGDSTIRFNKCEKWVL